MTRLNDQEITAAITMSAAAHPTLFEAGRRARVRGQREPSQIVAGWDRMGEQVAWLAGWHRVDRMLRAGLRVCRVCGCDDELACDDAEAGACWWVEEDLCSGCVIEAGAGAGSSEQPQ